MKLEVGLDGWESHILHWNVEDKMTHTQSILLIGAEKVNATMWRSEQEHKIRFFLCLIKSYLD